MEGAAGAAGLCRAGAPTAGVRGAQGTSLGEEKLFKGYYTQTGLVGNWWGSTMGSADASPCQHLLSVPHEDEQQGWSTRSPPQHRWGTLLPKPFGHPTKEEPPAFLDCGTPI